ncbi:type 4 prepilin-like proteins leader peptide-processing enzyme [Clostridia bacterium]|nr:type 4 prepilin-like proteins leader peptide-processing enzyme [Clostridia bacterium]
MQVYFTVVAGIFGLFIGSFANVVIYRVPRGMSVVKPSRSFCPNCQKTLKSLHLVPILSWMLLRGRCGFCHEPISPRYAIVEGLTGALFALSAWRFYGVDAIFICVLMAFLVIIAFIDLDTQNIYDLMVIPPAVLGLVWAWLHDLKDGLFGAALGFGVIFIINLGCKLILKRDGFGGGDMTLMGMCGLFLGLSGTLWSLYGAVIIGGLYGGFLMVTGRLKAGSYFAFGPFLCASVAAVILIYKASI